MRKDDGPDNKIDSEIEQEIDAMLGANPSADFISRVRTRIANSPEPYKVRLGWRILAVGGLAAAIFVAFGIDGARDAVRTEITKPLPSSTRATNTDSETVIRTISPVRLRSNVSKSNKPEPELLISPRENAAIHRVLSGAPARWIEISIVTTEPQPLPEIAVSSLPIFDLTAASKGNLQ